MRNHLTIPFILLVGAFVVVCGLAARIESLKRQDDAKIASLESGQANRATAVAAAENLRQEYLNASAALQKAADPPGDGTSTNRIALNVMNDVDKAITAAYYDNPTNAMLAIHNARMELDDIVVMFAPKN